VLVPDPPAATREDELITYLRLLLIRSTDTVAEVKQHLETQVRPLDRETRAQLADDVLRLDDELASLKAFLIAPLDWDAEYKRLLAGETPPLEHGPDEDYV
jgi:hypothetical protein